MVSPDKTGVRKNKSQEQIQNKVVSEQAKQQVVKADAIKETNANQNVLQYSPNKPVVEPYS